MKLRSSIFLLSITTLLLTGSGCLDSTIVIPPPITSNPTPPVEVVPEQVSWVTSPNGIETYQIPSKNQEALAGLILLRFKKDKFTFDIDHSEDAPRTVESWLEKNPNAVTALNGSYFHEDLFPSGLLITKGEKIGDRLFDWSRSGLLVLDNPQIIYEQPTEPKNLSQITEAIQSYPVLVKKGVSAVLEDSEKIATRTFVGLTKTGDVVIGCLPRTQVSLYTLSQEITKLPVSLESAINVDGGPSSGCAFNFPDSPKNLDSLTTVPNAILVTPK